MDPTISFAPADRNRINARASELDEVFLEDARRRADRHFAILLAVEWVATVCAAQWLSPLAWAGQTSSVHFHVWMAIVLGIVIAAMPLVMIQLRPASPETRHLVAASQMLLAGLWVHLSSGRIETHFAYFGLLAFLSFYYDVRILATATLIAGADHLLRAAYWPESMYGTSFVSYWRPLEHSAWLILEVIVLTQFIGEGRKSMVSTAGRQAELEAVSAHIASEVNVRTAELIDSETRYRATFEDSPLPMWLYDEETLAFVAVNQRAVETYGYERDEFLAMKILDIRPVEDVEFFQEEVAARGGPITRISHSRHLKKDGTVFDVEVSSHPVDWAGHKAVMVLSNDISARRQAEREKDAMEILLRHAQKLESIGQLASGIAHEINSPTQYIGDNLHFLRDSFREIQAVFEAQESVMPVLMAQGNLEKEVEVLRKAVLAADLPYLEKEIPEALDQALEGVNRVSTLVRAMKEFSHPGQKAKMLANLNQAIQSTIIVARNEWKYVAELETDFAADLPLVPCLISDFNQVVLNLIVNAAHAIAGVERNGGLGRIRIVTRAMGSYAEVRVEDTGTGIPVEARNRIFDPFFTTKEVGKGTGQGLAISRAVIVDKHGGTIHFETEMGKGTSFIIRMPLNDSAIGLGAPVDSTSPASSGKGTESDVE